MHRFVPSTSQVWCREQQNIQFREVSSVVLQGPISLV